MTSFRPSSTPEPELSATSSEINRIRTVYGARASQNLESLYHPTRPEVITRIARVHGCWAHFLTTLHINIESVLEVGSGTGANLRWLRELGAIETIAVDLLENRLRQSAQINPAISSVVADGGYLPFSDDMFDLIVLSTLFSSILGHGSQPEAVANEVLRVVRPGGAILWMDFFRSNPRNPDVRGVTQADIKSLFPGCSLYLKRVVLAPPLARLPLLAKRPWLSSTIELIPFIRTHWAGIITVHGTYRR